MVQSFDNILVGFGSFGSCLSRNVLRSECHEPNPNLTFFWVQMSVHKFVNDVSSSIMFWLIFLTRTKFQNIKKLNMFLNLYVFKNSLKYNSFLILFNHKIMSNLWVK